MLALFRPTRSRGSRGFSVLRGVVGLFAALGGSLALSGCGLTAQDGDCGAFLSTAECHAVRTQLGTLDRRPPPDPTNRFGRCVVDNSAECVAEDAAAALGKRLFFDRCLSNQNDTACVTCHQPAHAFIDDRVRAIMGPPITVSVGGVSTTMQLPLIENPTPDRMNLPPPMVQAKLDATGTPLAHFVPDGRGGGQWIPVLRRPAASLGSGTGRETSRHAPSLYNIAYGGGIGSVQHGERTYGVTWTPWDGRYDSAWALVADVWEFGGTHSTDRAHIAVRIGQKHRMAYENMLGGTLPNLDEKMPATTGKYIYLRHGSPANNCWFSGKDADCPTTTLAPTEKVRGDINKVFVNAGKALGAYMRRLRSTNSSYDRWFAGDHLAMSPAAQRGLGLFIGKAECVLCHSGPNFTDWHFHNLGVPVDDPEQKIAGSVIPSPPDARSACFDGLGPDRVCPDPGRQAWQLRADGQCAVDSVMIGGRNVSCQRVDQPLSFPRGDIAMDCRSPQSDATDKDQQCLPTTLINSNRCVYPASAECNADPLCQWTAGRQRCIARADAAELGQFKTPSLRNVALTFPYMHNGMLYNYGPAESGQTTSDDPTPHLTRVVEFYNAGGGKPDTGVVDPLIHPLHLAAPEIADLVEFLKALTDNSLSTASDPLTQIPEDLVNVDDCPDRG